jgi:uncharacterized protein (TIGR02452 family)
MSRTRRAEVAKVTLGILEKGRYTSPLGREVEFSGLIAQCMDTTRLYWPEELAQLQSSALPVKVKSGAARLEVANETTLSGIRRLLVENREPVVALNFASAKNPGGGFPGGSQAQEESLARASALHASLMRAWPFYEKHRALRSALYTDAMILSPACPIFRDDSDTLLEEVHCAGFVTSAAPNAQAVEQNDPSEVEAIPAVLRQRAAQVLTVAAANGYRRIVLGAWGCGVFKNDPRLVASIFGELLRSAEWSSRFSDVVFSVLDHSHDQATFEAFRREFR